MSEEQLEWLVAQGRRERLKLVGEQEPAPDWRRRELPPRLRTRRSRSCRQAPGLTLRAVCRMVAWDPCLSPPAVRARARSHGAYRAPPAARERSGPVRGGPAFRSCEAFVQFQPFPGQCGPA
jgi:hypothetical protein